jgi:glutamate-1-semialdehyde aminotransferase
MQAAHDSFISSTYWTEGVGPTAALATIHKFQKVDVPTHLEHIGVHMRDGLRELGKQHGLSLKISGHPALTSITFEHPAPAALLTLFTTRMIDQGILCGASFYPSWAHQLNHIARYLEAADVVFHELADAVKLNDAAHRLGGLVKHEGFKRLA